MNCYYSNPIEGHDAHPIDIERALKGDYSRDARKRDLQLEAKAHIAVQQWIDTGRLKGRAVVADSIREIQRHFCEALPDDLLMQYDRISHDRIAAGRPAD
jgi:hypothetical protein